jgi:xylan 1,4-beta-xylosidase
VQLRFVHLVANASYRLQVNRTGFHANDAYTAYIDLGSPNQLTDAQIAHLNEITRDTPETEKVVHSGSGGTVDITIPMNSNDIVLVKLARSQPGK